MTVLKRYTPINTGTRRNKLLSCKFFMSPCHGISFIQTINKKEAYFITQFQFGELLYKEFNLNKIRCCQTCMIHPIDKCWGCDLKIRNEVDNLLLGIAKEFISRNLINALLSITKKHELMISLSGMDLLQQKFIWIFNKGKVIYNITNWNLID